MQHQRFQFEKIDSYQLRDTVIVPVLIETGQPDKVVISKGSQSFSPFSYDDIKFAGLEPVAEYPIGMWDGRVAIAWLINNASDENLDLANLRAESLWNLLQTLDADSFSLASRAVSLCHWLRDHQFCGRCAIAMEAMTDELAVACPQCQHRVFPRISPCCIVLVQKGTKLLLAHNKNFPENLYSTLAGFIEAGESVEAALQREVREETGIEIDNIQYISSQAWPFPSQLMLGFIAQHAGGEIQVDNIEIDKADFFELDQLPQVPSPNVSISGQLIAEGIKRIRHTS